MIATQTFKHPRSSTAERLSAQAEGRHYSTFSLYPPEELRASIAAFLACLPSPEVSWVDEHLLVVIGGSRRNQVEPDSSSSRASRAIRDEALQISAGQPGEVPSGRGADRATTSSPGLGQTTAWPVVGGHVGPQLIRPPQERQHRVPVDLQIRQVRHRSREPVVRQRPGQPPLAQHRHCRHIHQVRRRQIDANPQLAAGPLPVRAVVPDNVGQHGRVDHDHRPDRSSARSCAACPRPTRPPRCRPIRSSTSSMLGRSASRRNSPARYCCNDWPRDSARVLAWHPQLPPAVLMRAATYGPVPSPP